MGFGVDDRSASLFTRLYERGMWLARDKQAFEGGRHTLLEAERRQQTGGALALAVTTRLRDLSRTLPAGVVTLSPWLDATLDEDAVADLEACVACLSGDAVFGSNRIMCGPGLCRRGAPPPCRQRRWRWCLTM